MKKTILILLSGLAALSSTANAGELTFNSLTKCNWFRVKELTRDIEYVLKGNVEVNVCYQIDERKEFFVIARPENCNENIGIYLDKNESRLSIDDNIKYVISKWEADH